MWRISLSSFYLVFYFNKVCIYIKVLVFATIETMPNKKGKKFLVTHNQECKKKKKKKKIEGYMHFLVGMKHDDLYLLLYHAIFNL